MAQNDHGNVLHVELFRGQHARVPGEDFIVGIYQNGVGPAELLDRGRDLSDLLAAVSARIADPRN
jgi:hypothetical protein